MARMPSIISVGIALSMTVCAQVPTQAADLDVKVGGHGDVDVGKVDQKTLIVALKNEVPQRTCDWIGPGGRAVYRCR
jgi:hypothetical protein